MRIGYARVSTEEQNLDKQLDALEEAGCMRVYSEKISGAADERPELESALRDLREGDVLVVQRLSRFGRSLPDLVTTMEELEEKGADFVSISEGIDTSTPQGRLTFHIFGALAEFYRELGRERTLEGLEAARERGRTGGRPPALTEEEIPEVQAMMRDEAVPTPQICDRFDVSKSTLFRYVGPDGERRK